jgi:tetratricopeptide (TPR) repeat protein
VAREHLTFVRQADGEKSRRVAISLNSLGTILNDAGRPSEAEKLFREALETNRKLLGHEHADSVAMLENLSHTLLRQEKVEEGAAALVEALTLRRRLLGDDHENLPRRSNETATFLWYYGDHSGAETLSREWIAVWGDLPESDLPQASVARFILGDALRRQGQWKEAETWLREALRIRREAFGHRHPRMVLPLFHLGDFCDEANRLEEAETFFRQALEIDRGDMKLWYRPDEVAAALAANLLKQGRSEEAEEMARNYLATSEPASRNAWLLTSLLGEILLERQDYAEAEPLLVSAWNGLRKLPRERPAAEHAASLRDARYRFLRLLAETGRAAEAERWLDDDD